MRKLARSVMSFAALLFLFCIRHGAAFLPGLQKANTFVPSWMALSVMEKILPFEQRVDGPRAARRMNHGFRYLHRQNNTQYTETTSLEFLSRYFTETHIHQMNASFPPLLDLNVSRYVYPKMMFLQKTMGATDVSQVTIPPQYFGARLERILAPRHAFLVYHNLYHSEQLINDPQKWTDFLLACRTTKRFCALCNQWAQQQQQQQQQAAASKMGLVACQPFTPGQIEAFDTLFGRGILAATRDDLVQANNSWPLEHVNVTSEELLRLLIRHGANPLERDNRGTSLLHWAAGTGNLPAVQLLLPYFSKGAAERSERDGATPLHWAAAGANSKEFGIGGHVEICQYLLSQCNGPDSPVSTKELVNMLAYDGNSPLMWASWSGTLDTVKLLVRNRADTFVSNRNGCTVAHWAASGGNLQVCKYLKQVAKANFFMPNHGGNTPLTHAVAFGRADVVQWIMEQAEGKTDEIAAALAEDFVEWTGGDAKRNRVLQLFRDDYWDDSSVADEAIALASTLEDF